MGTVARAGDAHFSDGAGTLERGELINMPSAHCALCRPPFENDAGDDAKQTHPWAQQSQEMCPDSPRMVGRHVETSLAEGLHVSNEM